MDNVCHTLVGAAMGEAGLNRRTRFASAALMISANLPDLDVLVFASDTSPVSFRRGWTHGIAAQIALPLLFTALLWVLDRRKPRRTDVGPPLHVGWMLLISYVGVYSHVFLDFLNNYGVRLLAPFEWRWFYGDSVFIIDPWLWLVLGLGVWLARRRQLRAAPRYALVIASVYIAAMLISARVSRAIVVERWAETHGSAPRALMVGPRFLLPVPREVIIDAGDHYRRGSFSWSRVELNPEPIPKNDNRPEVAVARGDPHIRNFLVWSRFPYWIVEPVEEGSRVTVVDARFMTRGTFSASTIVPARPLSSD